MPEYKFTPFIFLSSNNEEDTWIKNINDGADDFITKPFNSEVLLAKIKANLKKSTQRKEAVKISQAHNVSFGKGKICYCSSQSNCFDLPHESIICETIIAANQTHMLKTISEENIWAILIDDNTEWIKPVLGKILSHANKENIPVYILVEIPVCSEVLDAIDTNNYGGLIPKSLSENAIINQVNNFIQREIDIKDKYVSALSSAASNTPIKFEHSLNRSILDIDVSLFHEPFEKIPGGDFYEFFTLKNNLELIVIGDVMGKKWRAWFFSLAYIAYIRSTINFFIHNQDFRFDLNPEYLLEVLNKYIYKDLHLAEVFTTLSIILFDPNNSILRIASAGALRPLYYNFRKNTISRLNIVGTLLGVLEDTKYKCLELKLFRGDKLLLFTDGYPETSIQDNQMINEEGIQDCFSTLVPRDELTCKEIEDEIISRYKISSFDDDRTMLLVSKRKDRWRA